MTSEIIHDNSPSTELEFADPLRVLRDGRDQAFSKVSEFGSFFVNLIAGIEAEVLSQKHRHEKEVAGLERRLAAMTGNRDLLSGQVDDLLGRLEHKAPNPETAEALIKAQSKLTIAETNVSSLTRELDALKVKHAVVTEERDAALARVDLLLGAGDAAELAKEVEKLQGELAKARETAEEAIDTAERMVSEAQSNADRAVQEARNAAADPQELAAMQLRAENAEADVARLNGEAAWVLETAGTEAGQKAIKTLHAIALQSPLMTLAESLQIAAAALGVEAPEPVPVPEPAAPPAAAPEPAPVSFTVPEAEPAPAPISFDLQAAPAFDLQPTPAFAEPAPVQAEAPAPEPAPAPEAVQPEPAAPAAGEATAVPDVAHDFFSAPAPAPAPQAAQPAPVPGAGFFTPVPEATSPAAEEDEGEMLSADFFATAAPAGTETQAA